MSLPIALQLYTLREETEKDFIGTLEKVAEMGYVGVEFAGFGDISADVMRSELERLGLKAAGSHTAKDSLIYDLNDVIEYNQKIGNKFVVCPYDRYGSMDDLAAAAELYNNVGSKLKKNGIQFCYHNHSHEFERFGGKYALDILYSLTDPDLLKAEIDTYWVSYANVDPVGYLKKFPGRCPLVHLKDMGTDRGMTEIGEGMIDIKGLIKVSGEVGASWLIVEQDLCKRSPLESVKISIDNLKKTV